MSIVTDHVRRIDSQLDSFRLAQDISSSSSPELHVASDDATDSLNSHVHDLDNAVSRRLLSLQASVKDFSTASSLRIVLGSSTILGILQRSELLNSSSKSETGTKSNSSVSREDQELEWLLVGKATAQVYGSVLELLLDQMIPLTRDIEYWDSVLGSYGYMTLYSVQMAPVRLWEWAQDNYNDALQKLQKTDGKGREQARATPLLASVWGHFYRLVNSSIHERSIADTQSRLMSPLTMSQVQARSKRRHLRRLREMSATGLGVLVDEGMVFDLNDQDSVTSKSQSDDKEEWKSVVSKSVSLIEAVLYNITALDMGPGEFEEAVFTSVDKETAEALDDEATQCRPAQIALRLQQLLDIHMPAHIAASSQATSVYGRPSRLLRYWLPAATFLLSGSTILRVVMKQQDKIIKWIQEVGTTTVDFWYNWVVGPIKKVIGTIRHDDESEIAIMSKKSLQVDKASLERMVVDFATDNPDLASGTKYTAAQLVEVRAKVREGDLTPVLKAYEKDLRRPFLGTIRGDLIRALLIQIQKTKVDVEVAMGGIDNLLKSQELVFGFVGITPGVLVCVGVYQWLNGMLSGRQGKIRGQKQGSTIRVLRNIDRILVASTTQSNVLSYRDHGLLLCEAHVLRQRAVRVLPNEIATDFVEEIRDLVELRTGVERQFRVVERIRWAYAKYLC